MKRGLFCIVVVLFSSVLFHSCIQEEKSFDETLLYGRWEQTSGTGTPTRYRYDSDHTGVRWNPKEDISESEGQRFTWQLDKSELKQIHIMEIGGAGIPKNYMITELTATALKYKDSFSSYTFTRL